MEEEAQVSHSGDAALRAPLHREQLKLRRWLTVFVANAADAAADAQHSAEEEHGAPAKLHFLIGKIEWII